MKSAMNGVWELGRVLRQWQAEHQGTAWFIGAVFVVGLVALLIVK